MSAAGECGALARFVPDAAERGRVLEAVAHECAASAQASIRSAASKGLQGVVPGL